MILFALLVTILVILTIIIAVIAGVISVGLAILFGDIVIFMLIIGWLIKKVISKKRK